MMFKAPSLTGKWRWVLPALLLLAFPYLQVFGGEPFRDYSFQSSTDHSILLFPSHRIDEMLVNKPGPSIMTIDLPDFTHLADPQMVVAPHPKVRLMRVSQISAKPDVVRVSFIFHPGSEMIPRLRGQHLYLEDGSAVAPEPATQVSPSMVVNAPLARTIDPTIAPNQSMLDQTVNLQFSDEDLTTILNALAVKFNLRVYADSGVKGKFTINAREVPLREVLKTLLLQRNFQYTLKGRDLTIISLNQGSGRMARELLFKDLNLKDALQTLSKMMNVNLIIHESVTDKKVNFYVENLNLDELLDLLVSTNALIKKPHNDNTFVIMSKDEGRKFGAKEYRTFKLTNAKPDEVIKLISGSKNLSDRIDTGNIAVNERINALSVYDTPENLELLASVIQSVDEKLKQAVIELKLLEINRSTLNQLGVQFDQYGFKVADIGHWPKQVNFAAQIDLLERDNKAKVLASPRIRVVHGKKASIHIGEKIPVPRFTYEVSSLTLNTFERKTYFDQDVGINLEVTPEISRDNEISLELHTKVDSVIDINADGQVHRSNKETSTYVRIKDGETVVLGGLISKNESTTKQSPSLLNKVPLLRNLSGHTKAETRDMELIMLVTPYLVNLDAHDSPSKNSGGLMVEGK
jgi:type II secretory pathway component GspD/PulD (secretin)